MSEKKIEIDNDILFLIEKMIESGVNEGIQKGLKQYDNMQKNKTKFRYDKRLRNTRLLLKNYRRKIICRHTVCLIRYRTAL